MADFAQLTQELNQQKIRFSQNTALASYTSFHIGGNATLFCEPTCQAEIETVVSLCKKYAVPFYLLGRGSNTLFSDAGYNGLVLHIFADDIRFDDTDCCKLEAEAGANLVTLCKKAAQKGLSGLEFAYGIPGSVGGAVYMNAGAYGGEMVDVVTEVDYLDCDGKLCTAKNTELEFGYRTSIFEKNKGIILKARFLLKPSTTREVENKMTELLQRRLDKQPLDKPSAGSTFKRPEGAYAAALIEQCGLKGFQIGGAAVSEKHSGFVVNMGGATCADVVAVADHVAKVVKEQTGYTLKREIKVVE